MFTMQVKTSTDATASIGASTSTRVLSIDVLRGITIAFMILVNDAGDWGHPPPKGTVKQVCPKCRCYAAAPPW